MSPPEEYTSIQYLKITCPESKSSDDKQYKLPSGYTIEYLFDNFDFGKEPEPLRYFYPVTYGDNLLFWQDLQCFSGLTELDLGGIRSDIIDDNEESDYVQSSSDCDLRNLDKLQIYRGSYYQSLSNVTFADPCMLKEMSIRLNSAGEEKLLSDFINLEILRVDYFTQDFDLNHLSVLPKLHTLEMEGISNLSGLSSLTNLQHLHLYDLWDVTDFSVLYGLPGLLSLHLDNVKNLKDIGFVANMPKLMHFSLVRSDVIEIEALRDRLSILSLHLSSNNKLKDISSVSTLSSLQNLTLLDYDVELPEQSVFPNLKSAEVFAPQFQAIRNSNTLIQLHLHNCEISGSDLLNMQNLKSLKLEDCDLNTAEGLDQLPALTHLQILSSKFAYGTDWTIVFNLPHLELLEIATRSLPINHNKLKENHKLKLLSIQEDSYHSISLEDSTVEYCLFPELFSNFTGLEELYLPEITLQSIEFLSRMQNLRVLDISENYIKDVGVLSSLPNMEELYHGGNPISNLALVPEQVSLYNYRMPYPLDFDAK